ncbi:MAG: hypothetical protein KBF88_08675 [Polyangiaceae bacterium]|nr:hypothetical protein [Polyangiaceae bacterium]
MAKWTLLFSSLALLNPCEKKEQVVETPVKVAARPIEETTLEEAEKLCGKGDCQTGHERLGMLLAETSPFRQSPAFRAFEDRWAEQVISEAPGDPDPKGRKLLLQEVGQSKFVSAGVKKAADAALQKLEALGSERQKTPFDKEWDEAAKSAGKITALYDAQKTKDAKAARRILMPRASAGIATQEEANLLAQVCAKAGDQACQKRAATLGGESELAHLKGFLTDDPKAIRDLLFPRVGKTMGREHLEILESACKSLKDATCLRKLATFLK